MEGIQPSLEEPPRIIYTYHERFIQGLASAQSSFPLTRSHHETLKLVLEIWEGYQREQNHEGLKHISPTKPPRARPQNPSKKIGKKRL
jgi:hypothetical protein